MREDVTYDGHSTGSLHRRPASWTGRPSYYNDVMMSAMASQITSLKIVYSTVYSGVAQRKYQSSASLAFVRGIHRWPVNSPHKGPVTPKMFPFDDVIMVDKISGLEDWKSGSFPKPVCSNTAHNKTVRIFYMMHYILLEIISEYLNRNTKIHLLFIPVAPATIGKGTMAPRRAGAHFTVTSEPPNTGNKW